MRTAGPERKTGYFAGASLQVHCVNGKLTVCLTVRSGESARTRSSLGELAGGEISVICHRNCLMMLLALDG